jgi:hypothetical protein
MTRHVRAAVAIAALALAMSAHAQDRPNFAGRWASQPDSAAGRGRGGGGGGRAGDMGSGWGSTITIGQDGTSMTVEYAFFTRGDMQPPLRFMYALDGTETKNSVMMGRGIQQQTSTTAWDGPKLVITSVHTLQNPANGQPIRSEMKQVLSLDAPGTLVVETTRLGVLGGPPSTTRTVYVKVP